MYECIRTVKIKGIGMLRYFIVTTHTDENTETYGIAIEQTGAVDKFVEVLDVDCNKIRLIEFIKVLAKAYVTCCTLKYICEDYVITLSES